MSRTSKSPPPAPADSSRSRTTTRQRSDFNLEPNPFEQSFSATPRSASSNVRGSSPHRESLGPSSNDSNSKSDPDRPASRAKSRASQRRSASPSRPLLPPLASISSPADNGFAWGYPPNSINSLRAGPLSPAMLAGPQPSGDSNHVPFDSNYRTGLTPRTGMTPHSGLTPGTGLTPLVGAGAFPGSPNTSAFMAMINNGASGPTITPNTLNAISGVLNGTANNYTSSNLHQSHTAQDNSFLASANNAASTAANGLFLLSQAHQELTKREEAQARAGNNTSNTVPQNGQPNGKRGTKRKSYDMSSPPPPTLSTNRGGKRTRAPSGRRKPALRGESEDLADMDDDMDDDDMENDMDGDDGDLNPNGRRGNKKPETEEEKRRNFLERNRQAALKCRQRKKAWLAQLQAKVEYLSNENERLTSALVSSREEISRLSALVGGAGVVGSVPIGQNGVSVGGPGVQPVSMNVSLPNKSGQTPVGAGGGGRGGGGYGY